MADKAKESRKNVRAATQAQQAAPNAGKPAKRGITRLLIPILVVIALVAAGIAWLVHSNNVQSKATHEEFAAAQTAFAKADTAYKETAQKLETQAGACAKSYEDYDVCPALVSASKEVEKEYGVVDKDVKAIDENAVDKMPEATQTLKAATSKVQELERRADKAIDDYEDALLKAVRDEHSDVMNTARTNLKEAKALLSTSKGRTSDADLWEAISKMLSVHERELDAQDGVKSSEPDEIIASTAIIKMESAAIESELAHLQEIYDSKASPSASASASASEKADSDDAEADSEASEPADDESASSKAEDKESPTPDASESSEGLPEDPDA